MTVSLKSKFLTNSRGFTLKDGGGITWSINSNTNEITANGSGAGAGAANPTAKVGLTAVNGSAVTFMRSDAAPPLDQTVSPTWSGNHTFNCTAATPLVINGHNDSAGSALQIAGVFAGGGTTNLISVSDTANTNGVNIRLTGNGATTPSKTLRVITGVLQVTNSAYDAVILSLTDGGTLTLPGELAINGGTPTAPLAGFGSPSGSVTSGLSSSSTLAQTAGTLAALLAYLKTIGIVAA